MFTTDNAFTRVGICGVFGRTWRIFTKRLDIFLTLSAILYLLGVLLTFTAFRIGDSDKPSAVESVVVFLEFVVQLILAVVFQGAMARATAELYIREPATLDCVRHGCAVFCNLFCSTVLVTIASFFVPFILFAFALYILQEGGSKFLGIVLLLLAFLIFAYVYTPFLILTPTVIVERKGPCQAIKSSWKLGSQERLFIFCAVFMISLTSLILSLMLAYFVPQNFGGAMAKNLPVLFFTPFVVMYVLRLLFRCLILHFLLLSRKSVHGYLSQCARYKRRVEWFGVG